jgi:hypothetical protein
MISASFTPMSIVGGAPPQLAGIIWVSLAGASARFDVSLVGATARIDRTTKALLER